jgi:MinD superfamily P-loop ATPase
MCAVADSDVIVLVTESTPFGFYDFTLDLEAFSPLGKPMAVVVNRAGLGDGRVYEFCAQHGLPVVAEIPYRPDIAEHYSKGLVLAELDDGLTRQFAGLCRTLARLKESDHA